MGSAMSEILSVSSHNVHTETMSAIAIEVDHKLKAMGGEGSLKEIIPRIRERLSRVRQGYWHQVQASGRIKRFLYGEQSPNTFELEDIRTAYARFCPEKIRQNRDENTALIQSVIAFAHHAERADPEFYRHHLEALRSQLVQIGGDGASLGPSHRPDLGPPPMG
jgi:hypothetical protein